MDLTPEQYKAQLVALLPPGPAWRVESGGVLDELLASLAEELARVDERGGRLIEEADPRTSAELLGDWERVLSLPDDCTPATPVFSERQETVHQRLIDDGDVSEAGWIARAAALGHTITLTEFEPSRVGVMQSGDELAPEEAAFALEITAPTILTHPFEVGAAVTGDPLGSFDTARLHCELNRVAQAHTKLFFNFTT